MTGFFAELRRRNVFRVAVLYLVTAWLVLQVADVLFGIFRMPEWSLTLVALIGAIGFIPALLFAWVYEVTPEGVRKATEVTPDRSITRETGRKLNLAVIATAGLALAVFVGDRLLSLDQLSLPSGGRVTQETRAQEVAAAPALSPSIAVLPFVDLSPEGDQEYFADGIAEELLNLLARQRELKVAARTSSFAFKGREVPIQEIGDALEVSTVLEGSIRKSGKNLRITAQLINAESGYHMWSDTYDRELEDVFEVQDAIAQAIFDALGRELGFRQSSLVRSGEDQPRNVPAYEAFLEGQYYLAERSTESILKARELFQRATALDPELAPAWSGLAKTYLLMQRGRSTYGDLEAEEAAEIAGPLIDKALALDPELPDAHVTQGFLRFTLSDSEGAVEAYDRAIALNPSFALAYRWKAAELMERLQRYDEAVVAMKKAVELDPLSPVTVQNWVIHASFRGEYEEALASARRLLRMRPDLQLAHSALADAQMNAGQWSEAAITLLRAEALDPENSGSRARLFDAFMTLELFDRAEAYADGPGQRANVLYRLGEDEESERILAADLAEDPDDLRRNFRYAFTRVWRGKAAEARPYFESLLEASGDFSGWLWDSSGFGISEAIMALRAAGEAETAGWWLTRYGEFIEYVRDSGITPDAWQYAAARYHALSGEPEAAIGYVEALVARRQYYAFERDPVLEPLRGRPRFEAAVAKYRDGIAAQRREVTDFLAERERPERGAVRPVSI